MNKSLSIIIPVWKNEETINSVLSAANQLDPLEVLLITNEETELTAALERQFNCKVIPATTTLHDHEARTLGANAAKGELLLFLDGETFHPADTLADFIQPALTGTADVVLNNMDQLLVTGQPMSPLMVWCQVLNEIVDRPDFKLDSILFFPHAVTRKAAAAVGIDTFSNPFLTQLRLIEQGWKIGRKHAMNSLPSFLLKQETSNDHRDQLQMLEEFLQKRDARGGFTIGGKRIDILNGLKKHKEFPSYRKGKGVPTTIFDGKQLSVVIPAQNEEQTIGSIITEVRKMGPLEIIVVVNGSDDQTAAIAAKLGATVIEYKERLGHNVGRAVGALEAVGDIILFIDSDFVISAHDLLPFPKAVANGVDMALNNLNGMLPIHILLHNVSAMKYAVNLLSGRMDLGIGSLLAVPHAISRSCLDRIGFETLVCPSLAQIKAILQGQNVSCVHAVNVMKPNRIRPDQHLGNSSEGGNRDEIMERLKESAHFSHYQEELSRSSIIKGWGIRSSLYNEKQLSVIIPAQNHEKTIGKVIGESRKMEPIEVIVVTSGSNDETKKIAQKLGATIINTNEPLNLETARAIGALSSAGDFIYFVDPTRKGQSHAELRIIGDHLEAISYLINQQRHSSK